MANDYAWDGGRPCLDLINTLRDRKTGPPREQLEAAGDLADWLVAAGLLDDGRVAPSAAHLERARALRDAVDRLVLGDVRGSDVELVNELAGMRRAPRRLVVDRGRVVVETAPAEDPVTVALGAIAADLVALLGDRSAVKICASADCGLRFEDRSPAGNRQWCSMSRCGNREKARQHYRRRPR